MSDRFLAITLALVLALPLCLSLDGDLFGHQDDPRQTGVVVPGAQSSDAEPLDEEIRSEEMLKAARRFSLLAVEVMKREAQGLQENVPRQPQPAATEPGARP